MSYLVELLLIMLCRLSDEFKKSGDARIMRAHALIKEAAKIITDSLPEDTQHTSKFL